MGSNKKAAAPPKAADERRLTRGRVREGASFPVAPGSTGLPSDYGAVLADLKRRIQQERIRIVLAANAGMVLLCWDIGRVILERQSGAGWGAKVIDRLSQDLRRAFPYQRGFSPRNLKYMRAFAAAWPEHAIVQQLAAQIPWFHHCLLLDRVSTPTTREWYVQATIDHGWSRSLLDLQIENQAHRRQGQAITNFKATLPPADSDMAAQALKKSRLKTFGALVYDGNSPRLGVV